ncbi:dienelactone hydrolase [Xylariales sp. AK1849]|nr:dienelactone hydrolase [Xylariales sp. AK1849]
MTRLFLRFSCTIGHLHDGTPTGEIKSIDGIQLYYALPADGSTKKAILILSDAMGYGFVNTQLLADNFAANGFFAVVPDLFRGDAIPLGRPSAFDSLAWLKNHLPEDIEPIVNTVIKHMKLDAGCTHLAGVGYCFGAKYVARYLKPGIFDAGFIAHPTHIDAEDILGIKRPLSVAAGALDDHFNSQKRHEMESMLKRLDTAYQLSLYSNVGHGFAVRGNMKDPGCRFAKDQAFSQAVQWLNHYLAN